MQYVYLGIAIVCEVIATTFMKQSEGFTRLWPSVVTVLGYVIAFYCLSLTLRTIPTGIAYAIWSGVGTGGISLLSAIFFDEAMPPLKIMGLALVILGMIVINMDKKAANA